MLPVLFQRLPAMPSAPKAAVIASVCAIAAFGALGGCSADENEVEETDSLGLPQACLAFEAAAPPGIDEDVREELKENPPVWRFYRAAYANFSWSTGKPLHYIEMRGTDDYDPTQTDVWQAMNDYHAVIEAMSNDFFSSVTRDSETYPTWEQGARALDKAGAQVEAACLEVGAEVEIAQKIGILAFEDGDPYRWERD